MSLRVFLAVDLSAVIRQALVQLQDELRGKLPKVNWVRPESIHLTLKFLGYVEVSMVDQLREALEPLGKGQSSFMINVQGLGVFPLAQKPRILWVGLTGEIQPLLNVVSQIEEALEPLGFVPEERPYHPHLTLARIKHESSKVGSALNQAGVLEEKHHLGKLEIDRLTLFQSELGVNGAKYTPLWSVPFTGDSVQ